MIAYDLDGVLVADVLDPDKNYVHRPLMQPLFVPRGSWILITGRPGHEQGLTQGWAQRCLADNPPVRIHHNPFSHLFARQFKAGVLKAFTDISLMVESDPDTVEFLRGEVTRVRTVLFRDLVNEALLGVST